MVTTTSSVVVPVDPRHRLDEARLLQYLQASIPGFLPPPATLHVLQFGHGQSNPTYLLHVELNGVEKRFVLRKKPPGKLLQSAHAVEREYEVLLLDMFLRASSFWSTI
jgi:acyl-CoA dehydrogenase